MNVEAFKNVLLRIPTAKLVSGGSTINCRCMYCGDSRKHSSSKHFYISVPPDDVTPSLYYCHLCHNSGVVTYKKLIEWDIFDESVAIDLVNHNKKCDSNSGNKKYFQKIIYMLQNITTTDNAISRYKLKYINDRLGCNFDYGELRKLKIVLNLNDLLKDNYITSYSRSPQIVDQLDKNFLGFLSIDNAFLNMRRLCDKGLVYESIDSRYINYKIKDKFDTSERFYTIPTTVDLNKPERVKIHVAEGPFDILSVYKNLRHEEPGIYTSIGGSNYKGIAMYFLETYKLPYSEFHYYPDNDKYGSNKYMVKIAEYLKPLSIPMYVHRNTCPGQKDFGVSPEFIREYVEQLRI